MEITPDRINRLRVMWKKSRNYFQSFIVELEGVKNDIGDDVEFAKWCIHGLGISSSIIEKTTEILRKTDAAIARESLAEVNRAHAAKVRQEKEEEARRKQLEKEAYERERAEQRLETARIAAEAKRLSDEIKGVQTPSPKPKRQKKSKDHPAQNTLDRRKREATEGISKSDLQDCVSGYHKGEALCKKGSHDWVTGSIAKIEWLKRARDLLTDNQGFGDWCNANIPLLGKNDRAALLSLGRFLQPHGNQGELRKILTDAESRSYQLIWQNCRSQQGNVTELFG